MAPGPEEGDDLVSSGGSGGGGVILVTIALGLFFQLLFEGS